MPVIRNYKICDNAKSCNAISVCPTGAFKWNEDKKTLEVDENLCIGCGLCETSPDSCPIGAIKFARTKEEERMYREEIENDPRSFADLIVDRYGCQPFGAPFSCNREDLSLALTSSNICLVEVLKEELEECLIKSIPIKEIMKGIKEKAIYRKIEEEIDDLVDKYNIKEMPALLIFKNNKLLGKIEGYYSYEEKDELIKKINEIIE